MYNLKTEASFDSAHFLHNYNGKCSNIHGHRWTIIAEIQSDCLMGNGQHMGMIVDFCDFKKDLREIADSFDHALIYEKNTLKTETIAALKSEDFHLIQVSFRPTAENFAKYFYDEMKNKGYNMKVLTVYETPNNCASYSE